MFLMIEILNFCLKKCKITRFHGKLLYNLFLVLLLTNRNIWYCLLLLFSVDNKEKWIHQRDCKSLPLRNIFPKIVAFRSSFSKQNIRRFAIKAIKKQEKHVQEIGRKYVGSKLRTWDSHEKVHCTRRHSHKIPQLEAHISLMLQCTQPRAHQTIFVSLCG